MNDIVIIGGVGTALNIIEHITQAAEKYCLPARLKGVVIDSYEKGSLIGGVPVLGGLGEIASLLAGTNASFLFAMYKPGLMKERYALMKSLGIPSGRFASFIHPSAFIAPSVVMGTGNIILSNVSVNSNVVLGSMNIVSSNVIIEHDTVAGDGNFFAAGSAIGARVHIGNHCFTGLNSSLREDVSIDEVFVGMHSLVLTDFRGVTVAGVPAVIMKPLQ